MHIWVDADACPGVIKDILFRAAERARISMTLVANQLLRTPPSPYIRALQVPRVSMWQITRLCSGCKRVTW